MMEPFYRCLGYAADTVLYVMFMHELLPHRTRRTPLLAAALALLAGYSVYRLAFGYGLRINAVHDVALMITETLLCYLLNRSLYGLPHRLALTESLIFVIAVQASRKIYFHVLLALVPGQQALAYLETQLIMIVLKVILIWLVTPHRRDISEEGVKGMDLFLLLFALYPCFLMSFINVQMEVFGWSWNVNLICYVTALLCAFIVKQTIADHCEMQRVTCMNQMRQRQYERLLQSQSSEQEIRRMCHDLKHQLRALQQDPQNAGAMLSQVENELKKHQKAVYADNPILNSLLQEKVENAGKNDICIDIQSRIPPCAVLSDLELCLVFGNALDNALEAVRQAQTPQMRYIRVNCLSEPGFWAVLFENPYQGVLNLRSGLPATTKPDSANHGIGLRSIRDCAEKHGGTLAISTAGQKFTLSVMVPLGTNE